MQDIKTLNMAKDQAGFSPSAVHTYLALTNLAGADITIHQDRCIMVRNRNAGCAKCADACTSQCITFERGQIQVNKDNCVGCGTCSTVCPTCAIEALNPSDAQLISEALSVGEANNAGVYIACEQVLPKDVSPENFPAEGTSSVRVVCLGRVDESFLAGLAEHHMEHVVLVHGNCDLCQHAPGYKTVQSVVQTAGTLFDTWGCPMSMEFMKCENRAHVPAEEQNERAQSDERATAEPSSIICEAQSQSSQSDEFISAESKSTICENGQTLASPQAKPHFLKVMKDGTLPHFIPDRRERLLDSLATLGNPKQATITTRLWGHVEIDIDACTSCRMCATFCPTGALLKYDTEDGTIGLEHYSGDCVQCLCCENICRTNAIHVVKTVDTSDIMQGQPVKIPLNPIAIPKGTVDAMALSMRSLLGMEEVFDR